ncbi:hypothetical protein HN011_012356 [Eciton burchellii]|nr:hypothetical protein HN011_012356 [Eciton burchellii]
MYMGDQVLGYTCTMCSKFYKMWSNYLKHKYRLKDSAGHYDSNELPGFYTCCECKKIYKSRMALNRHVREECGRILYTCPYCHNIMPMKFNLLNHLKKEHGC